MDQSTAPHHTRPRRPRGRWRAAAVVAVVTAGVVALAGCSSAAPSADASSKTSDTKQSALLTTIKDRGYATIGIYDSPPDSTATDGQPAGLMPDIDVAILKRMGIKKFHAAVSDFAGLAPGLQSGSVDMVSGAFFVTKERCDVMAFGNPITVNTYSFITANGKPTFKSFKEIKDAGAKLAIENGTYQQTIALKTLTQDNLLSVTSRQSGIDAVVTGQADVYVAPTRILTILRKQNHNDYTITDTKDIPPLATSLAVAPQNADFMTEYNKAWKKVFDDGTAKKIMAKYDVDFDQFMKLKDNTFSCN